MILLSSTCTTLTWRQYSSIPFTFKIFVFTYLKLWVNKNEINYLNKWSKDFKLYVFKNFKYIIFSQVQCLNILIHFNRNIFFTLQISILNTILKITAIMAILCTSSSFRNLWIKVSSESTYEKQKKRAFQFKELTVHSFF